MGVMMPNNTLSTGGLSNSQNIEGRYSTKRGAFKYLKGSFDGLLSSAIAYCVMKYYPDMPDSDRDYIILMVVPAVCGVPPVIRHWFKSHTFGRAITWYVSTNYHKALKKIFRGIPDEVINDTSIEEQ